MALGQKEVTLKIKADTKKFHAALKQLPGMTEKEAKKMSRKMAREFNKAEKGAGKSAKHMAGRYSFMFEKITKDNAKAQAALGAGMFLGAVAGLAKLAHSASEYTDKVMLMSKQTGLSSETLIGMEFAAKAAGSSIDEMRTGLNAFVMKAGQAANIGGASAAVFDRLGVSVKDAGGSLRSTEDIFRDSINAIAGMGSASEKATTAAELFGAKGAKIAAVFAGGTGSLDEWAQKAKEAGIVMDGRALKASADMDRQMADLKLTIRGVVQETGNDLIPAMILIAKAVGTVIKQVGSLIVGWDNLTDSMFGNIAGGEKVQQRYYAQEKAIRTLKKEVENYDGVLKSSSGRTIDGARAAAVLQARLDHTADAIVRVGQGYDLTSGQTKKLHLAWNEATVIAGQLGISMDDLKSDAAAARLETQRLAETELKGLEGELSRLGKSGGGSLRKLGKDGEKAAEALAELNRSFELEALGRVDEPLAKFEKEIDRINAALLSGLEAQLGHDAILAATDALNAARLEKEQEMQDKIAGVRDKRRERDLKAEEESAKASQAMQEEFFSGTQDLANNVFEFAKNQRGVTFEEEQALAIAQAVMNTAVGVTSALKKGVAGIPAALLVGAEGALQVAAIRSQTMHAGGIVGSTPDERPANLLTGEAVITRAGVDALGGSAGVNSINSGASMAPIVVVNQYKHRSLDVQIRDQLRSDSALTRATAGGQRMGHR
jgi:hypothetical protein